MCFACILTLRTRESQNTFVRFIGEKMSNILRNFWVLEGLDGAGTTTQLRKLEAYLSEKGAKVHCTAEPTVNETGRFLRRVLSGEIRVPQSTVAYLFAADRDDHVNNPEYGIVSHVEAGEIVVSDRYIFSSLAYQSIGFDFDRVMELNQAFPFPEVVMFIDTPLQSCIDRIDARGQAKEIYERLDYQRQVLENYERVFSSLPSGCRLVRVDGSMTREAIFDCITRELGI